MRSIVGVDFDDVKLGTFAFWRVPTYPYISGGVVAIIHTDTTGPMHGAVQVLELPNVWIEPVLYTEDDEVAFELLKAIDELKLYQKLAIVDMQVALDVERHILLSESIFESFKEPAEED